MFTIVQGATGFAAATALASGCQFNTCCYVRQVLTSLTEWWYDRGGGIFGDLILHADNACPRKTTMSPHFMARNGIVIAGHPPDSQNLATPDFYLFSHVKGLFRGESFETGQVLSAVNNLLRSLEKLTLTRVFLEWMRRLERYIDTDGDYVG
jgi:hypothetical protein